MVELVKFTVVETPNISARGAGFLALPSAWSAPSELKPLGVKTARERAFPKIETFDLLKQTVCGGFHQLFQTRILLGVYFFAFGVLPLNGQTPAAAQMAVTSGAPASQPARPTESRPLLIKIRSKCQPDAINRRNVTWTLEVENPTDKPIGEIVYESTYLNQFGNVLGKGGGKAYSIRQVIQPHSQKAIEVKEGPIPERTANAEIQVVSAAFLQTDPPK